MSTCSFPDRRRSRLPGAVPGPVTWTLLFVPLRLLVLDFLPLAMRSMKLPLGSIDTRVTMTDSPVDDRFSPSFASEIGFDSPPYDNQTSDGVDACAEAMNQAQQLIPADPHKKSQKQHSRLELDVDMDKYHTLDGFAEPLNPQNTPATNSGHESPAEASRRRNAESLRSSSAPQSQPLNFDWFDDKLEQSLFLPGDGDGRSKTQRRRFSADDEPLSTTSTTSSQSPDQAADGELTKTIDDIMSPLRCVRFTPPAEPSQPRSPRPVHRPLPSIERKQDYIASHRQQKQYEKWRGPSRALAQRVSPYRSPPKLPKPLLEPNVHFSGVPNLCHQSESSTESAQDTQGTSDNRVSETTDMLPQGEDGLHEGSTSSKTDNLVAVTVSVYRRLRSSGSDPRETRFHIQLDLRAIHPSVFLQQTGESQEAVVRTAAEDLLFHTCVIMPAWIWHIPIIILLTARQISHSRIGIITINMLRIPWVFWSNFWSTFFITLMSRWLGGDVVYEVNMRPVER